MGRSKTEDAEIHWGDETAVSSVEHYPRGYAPKGKTPVLVLSQSNRHRTNLISSITNQGTMRFMIYQETLTAKTLIQFLGRLIEDSKRRVFLILDNLQVQHTRKVRQWLEQHRDEIELCLPAQLRPGTEPGRVSECRPEGADERRRVRAPSRSDEKESAVAPSLPSETT